MSWKTPTYSYVFVCISRNNARVCVWLFVLKRRIFQAQVIHLNSTVTYVELWCEITVTFLALCIDKNKPSSLNQYRNVHAHVTFHIIFTARWYAEHGIFIVMVCRLSVCNVGGLWSHTWEFSKIILQLDITCGVFALHTPTSRIYSKENTLKFWPE